MVVTGDNGWERWRGSVEAKLDALTTAVREISGDCTLCRGKIDADLRQMDRRIRSLEIRVARLAAAAAAVGAVIGATVGAVVTAVVQSWF